MCCVQVQLINDAYNLVIDAMLGPESDWANIKEPYSGILVTLKQVKIPIASVDVPSGRCSCTRSISGWRHMMNEPSGSCPGALAPRLEVRGTQGDTFYSLLSVSLSYPDYTTCWFWEDRKWSQSSFPPTSLFVPSLSGWDIEEPSQDGINPDVLISLTAPKKCAMNFTGKHFLAGRFLPYDIQKKYELNLPDYPGTDCLIEL